MDLPTIFSFFIVAFYLKNTDAWYVKKSEPCGGDPNDLMDFKFGPKIDSDHQKIDITIATKTPMGENTVVKDQLYFKRGNEWIRLLNINHEKGFCDFMTAYAAEMWHDIERALGFEPKTCPPPGNYTLKDHVLDYSKIPMTTLPLKNLKSDIKVLEKGTNRLIYCATYYIDK